MKLLIANSSQETGALLRQMLDLRGASRDALATVCYGLPTSAKYSLNAKCGADKIERLVKMEESGVSTVPWFQGKGIPNGIEFPLLARKMQGHGGTDIVPVFQPQEVEWRVKAGWDWFSSYIPVAAEYRVWIFRGQHLDTYRKEMVRPQDFKYIGRNFRNGFDFVLDERNDTTFIEASEALIALELDFGAVDLLVGKDGNVYILEVNTAPGVIKSGAQKTLAKLADCIMNWEKDDYPNLSR